MNDHHCGNITKLGGEKQGKKNPDQNLVQKTGDFHQKNFEIWRPLEKKICRHFHWATVAKILPGKRTLGSLAFGALDVVGGLNIGVPKILTLVIAPFILGLPLRHLSCT
jgi:hypothetical protein